MSVRSVGQKASFDILAGDSSGDERSLSLRPNSLQNGFPVAPSTRRKRKSRKRKAAAAAAAAELNGEMPSVRENGHCENFAAVEADSESLRLNGGSELRQRKLNGTMPEEAMGIQLTVLESRSVVETVCETTVVVPEPESLLASSASLGEVDESAGDGSGVTESSAMRWMPESNGGLTRLETVESLDWKRVLAENPSVLGGDVSPVYRSPLKYFMGEIYGGSSLRSTISVGNDKKRQRVYNTVFHVPVRCERLIVAGFFVCLDSFLSLLTIMPARIVMTIWRVLTTRQFLRPNAAELSDFGCFIVLASGVTSLQLTDISLIYHIIRGQGILKLYVVYNVLEIFDKLCQSFGEDVLQVLFNSAEGLATCSADKVKFVLLRFVFDQTIAVTAFIVHSFVFLAQAITLSTCIIATIMLYWHYWSQIILLSSKAMYSHTSACCDDAVTVPSLCRHGHVTRCHLPSSVTLSTSVNHLPSTPFRHRTESLTDQAQGTSSSAGPSLSLTKPREPLPPLNRLSGMEN